MAKKLTQFEKLLQESRAVYRNYMTIRQSIKGQITRAKNHRFINGGRLYSLKTITIDEYKVPEHKRTYVSSRPYHKV